MHYQRAVNSFFPYILDTVWRLSKFSPFICLGRTHKIIGWMGKPLPIEDWVQGKEVADARTSWLEVPGSQELRETSHHLMETKEHRPLNSESARIKCHSRCPFSEEKTEEDNERTFGRKLFPQGNESCKDDHIERNTEVPLTGQCKAISVTVCSNLPDIDNLEERIQQ